jgi:hypothetical protein
MDTRKLTGRRRTEGKGRVEHDPVESFDRIEITGRLDRHAVEAMRLEIRRVASRYGIDLTEFRIERQDFRSSA